MTRTELTSEIFRKKSYLCLGLDPDMEKIPAHLKSMEYPLFTFCTEVANASAASCVAFKINTAFFESLGSKGFLQLEMLCHYLHENYPTHLLIADAKRGDIGNTSGQYAEGFFRQLKCDAITLHPYMGKDSLEPFFAYSNKWSIVLALTSNPGAKDFELLQLDDRKLFEEVLVKTASWGTPDNTMFVVGATRTEYLIKIRALLPDHFLLVPGTGAQGGNLHETITLGRNKTGGLLINVSRDILFVSSGTNYAAEAGKKAAWYAGAMAAYFDEKPED